MLRLQRRLLSAAVGSPEISAQRLVEIIGQSDKVPVGRITDHFDKHMKHVFMTDSLIVSQSLLAAESETKLQLPEKVREYILCGIGKNFESLNRAEILSIPRLLRRLPQTPMASESEDSLFERFLSALVDDLSGTLTASETAVIVRGVAQLHFKHPCKEEPIVRLFQSFSGKQVPPAFALTILEAAGSTLSKQKLSHSIIRSSCLGLLEGIEHQCLGRILDASSKLPLFPEAGHLMQTVVSRNVFPADSDARANGLVGIAAMTDVEILHSQVLPKLVGAGAANSEKFLSAISERSRLNRKAIDTIVDALDGHQVKSTGAIAGYLRLLAETGSERIGVEAERLLPNFPNGTENLNAIVTTMRCATAAAESTKETFFRQHIVPCLGELGAGAFKTLVGGKDDWLLERLAKSVNQITNPEALAVMLMKVNTDQVGEKLRGVLKSADLNTQIRIWKILSEDGLVYANPGLLSTPRGRLLKDTTAAVFRSVRMAPVRPRPRAP